MAILTGCLIRQRYAPGKRRNSFYQGQKKTSSISRTYSVDFSKSETLYYVDNKTGELKAKNTLLLG